MLPELPTDERPQPDGPPTTVEVGWGVVDVLDIDDVNQQLEGDFILTLAWVDPRLEGLEGCRFQRTRVWGPQVTLFNSFSLTARRANLLDQVVIGPEGRVVYQQRYGGRISTYHPLQDFPFDHQAFHFRIGSMESGPEQLRLTPMPERTFLSRRLNIEGWRITGLETAAAIEAVPALNAERSIFTATLEAERIASYYVFKIVLPMGFIVMMSWAIFWVPPQRYEFQIGLGATSMLTLIAFQFSMSGYLPRLGYFTIADRLVVWATILVFLAILNAIVTGVLVTANREAAALRFDRQCRWLFPLLLLLGWGSVLL
ncbi:hypothetical protein [Halomonas getboli]|uniref:hypothetical protein n=1 Tax=Halomonas getboli TaxID=2935862 RepID=UPI001FFFEDA0|nr:hypothetical protein [Halomonas getboli]MCK2185389.1 hypothetical protein [Halomonas getboli]